MEPITQGILGAAVGQVGFHKQLGRKALLWGAVIATLPDLDILIRWPSDPFLNLIHHRGITHSLWFGPIIGPLIGYFLWRYYGKVHLLSSWVGLVVWALITHPLLDVFTVYGTQLLFPFSFHRFSFSGVAVIDPIYTIILLICLPFGIFIVKRHWIPVFAASLSLVLSTGYLFLGIQQNDIALHLAERQLKEQHVNPSQIRSYTTLFQIYLRRIIAHIDNQVWVGFISTWNPQPIHWHKYTQPSPDFVYALEQTREGKLIDWFTSHEYAYVVHPGQQGYTIEMLDSRFGFPGPTILGPWGIQTKIDGNGGLLEQVNKRNIGIKPHLSDIITIFTAAFDKTSLIWQLEHHNE
jgi:inner membrane protein